MSDFVELQCDDRVDQFTHRHVSVAARRQAERRDDCNSLTGFDEPDLGFQQVDRLSALPRYTTFRQLGIDELLMGVV